LQTLLGWYYIEESSFGTSANNCIVFESFSIPQSVPSFPQGTFDFAQETFQSRCKTRVIDELIRTHAIEAFDANVVAIGRRLREGKITNTRQLELELICAGKASLK
jgi:hypothetical protein